MPPSLSGLNTCDEASFVAALGPLFEHSPWVAAETFARRPFRDPEHLLQELYATLAQAGPERQLALIRAHPDLAGRLAQAGQLTAASAQEQASAGLNQLTPAELPEFQRLNGAYLERFGFPFVICARLNAKDAIMAAMRTRLRHSAADEHRTALGEIEKIARLRLRAALADPS